MKRIPRVRLGGHMFAKRTRGFIFILIERARKQIHFYIDQGRREEERGFISYSSRGADGRGGKIVYIN